MSASTSTTTSTSTLPFELEKHEYILKEPSEDNSNTRKPSRKRRRRILLPLAHAIRAASTPINHDNNHPNTRRLTQLFAGSLLTTALVVLSAFDAKEQCFQQETYALLKSMDDDNFQRAYETVVSSDNEGCRLSFAAVVQTAVITTALGIMSLFLLRVYAKKLVSLSCCLDQQELQQQQHHRTTTFLRLLLLTTLFSIGIVVSQTRTVDTVMLTRTANSNTNTNDDTNNNNNPYASLAAVDRLGQVGDNANLYYLVWISEALALSTLYQLVTATVRYWRRSNTTVRSEPGRAAPLLRPVPWNNIATGHHNHHHHHRLWFQHSLYRLRVRTGIWVAAFVTCLVIVAASLGIWRQVIWPYVNYNNNNFNVAVCRTSSSPAMCRRTLAAWLSGVAGSWLCATAIGMHWAARRQAMLQETAWHSHDAAWEQVHVQNRLPLRTELVLSLLLSCLLGFNAIFCTGVLGPASTVGNLYYASWLAFLLCVRICLGCVEEYNNIEDMEEKAHVHSRHGYKAPNIDVPKPTASFETNKTDQTSSTSDPLETNRVNRLRSYFFLGIFSVVCTFSALDSALNQNRRLSRVQKYYIIAPMLIGCISACLFALCLSRRCYMAVSHWWSGGLLAVLCFGIELVNLILTMHNEDSWAVNSIGEVKMANLYYFNWASIVSAGMQMMSYVKSYFQINYTDYMSVVWIAICKVCFIILGASLHIWNTISGNCEIDQISFSSVTFCSKTVLAILVSITGILIGVLVVLVRMFLHAYPRCRCKRIQSHVELLISMFLVLLFGAALALITGIGGPGQSVGDLYYSTWLAFWVSLWIFVTCYSELQEEEGVELNVCSVGDSANMHKSLPPAIDDQKKSTPEDSLDSQLGHGPSSESGVLV
jgi:hypothetical protein